jgi:dTDP-4-amino-4,6-dideoxygalactose transaminase
MAEIIREKGTNRSRFFRGQVDKYTWVGLGSSYVMSDLLAAILYAQLEARELIAVARARVWNTYQQALQPWAASHNVQLPHIPEECEQSHHLFYLMLPSLEVRQRLIAHLQSHDILAVFHYQALHLSPMGEQFGGRPGQCPVSEKATDCLLRLPFYTSLTESDQARVIETVQAFRFNA